MLTSNSLQVHPRVLLEVIAEAAPEFESILAIALGMKTPVEYWVPRFDRILELVDQDRCRCKNQVDLARNWPSNHLYSLVMPACPADLAQGDLQVWSSVTYPMNNVVNPFPTPEDILGGTTTITFNSDGGPVHPDLAGVKIYNHLYHYANATMRGGRKEVTTVQQYNDTLACLKRLQEAYEGISDYGFGLRVEARILAPTMAKALTTFELTNVEDPFSVMHMMNIPNAKRIMYAIPREYYLARTASVLQQEMPLARANTRKVGKTLSTRMHDIRNMMNVHGKGKITPQHGPHFWWNPEDSSDSESDHDSDDDANPKDHVALPAPDLGKYMYDHVYPNPRARISDSS